MENQSEQGLPKRQSARSSMGIWFFVPLAIGFVMILILALQWKETLIVQRVVVEGARIMGAKEVVGLANIQPQALLYQTDLFTVRQRLLAQPLVKSAVVTRQLPDAFCIEIVEREPIAALGGGPLYCLDTEGVVLPHRVSTPTFDLPLINGLAGAETVKVGNKLDQNDVFEAIGILEISQRIDAYRLISEIDMNKGGEVVLYSTEGGVPIMLGRGDFGKKLLLLQSFWNEHVRPEVVSQLKVVDLRYSDQVVARWETPKESPKKAQS